MENYSWEGKAKCPAYKEDYQPSSDQYAGSQMGMTNNYVKRRDQIQKKEAGKIRSQNYRGRYE